MPDYTETSKTNSNYTEPSAEGWFSGGWFNNKWFKGKGSPNYTEPEKTTPTYIESSKGD